MTDLLSNTSTFIPITRNPLKKLQTSTFNILKRLNDNNFLKHKFHNNHLTLTNTVLAKCYGLQKTHKQDIVVDDDHVLLSLDVTSLFTNVLCDLVLKSLDRRCQLIHNNCGT